MGQGQQAAHSGWLARIVAAVRQTGGHYRELNQVPAARRLLVAATGSYVGDGFNTVALIALSYKLGDGALGVGFMLAISLLPRALFQGLAGGLVDRRPGPALLIASHLALGGLVCAYAALAVVPSLWLLYGLALAAGIVRTVAMPAFEVELMAVTPPAHYGTANGLHALARTAGDLVGPLLGGLLLALVGPVPLFLLNGTSYLGVALAVATNGGRRNAPAPADAAPATALGYRALLARADVRFYAALTVAEYALYMGAIAVFVVQSRAFGLGDGGVGLFYTALGVGSLVGGIAGGSGDYRGRWVFAVTAAATAVFALGMAGFAVAGGLALAALALALAGGLGDLSEISALTGFQHRLPAAVYGRFFSLFLMATGVGAVLGAILGPLLTGAFGVGPALGLLALPVVAVALPFALREGLADRAFAIPALAPDPEPEVVGYGMFVPPPDPAPAPGPAATGPSLTPRLSRLR